MKIITSRIFLAAISINSRSSLVLDVAILAREMSRKTASSGAFMDGITDAMPGCGWWSSLQVFVRRLSSDHAALVEMASYGIDARNCNAPTLQKVIDAMSYLNCNVR